MTASISDAASNVDRRQLLTRAMWGSVGAAVVVAAPRAEAKAHRAGRVIVEVACFGNTFAHILAPGASPTDQSNWRGTTFVVEGALYRAGTIPVGVTDWDPSSATPIGQWFCRGWFISRTGRPGEADRPEPTGIVDQDYVVGLITPAHVFPRDTITTAGLTGTADLQQHPIYSVTGGTGRFLAARGQITQRVIGANTTGAPNFVCDFQLLRRGR